MLPYVRVVFKELNVKRTKTNSISYPTGKLVLISQGERIDTGENTYDDNQWHVVTVTHNKKVLRLGVDDFDSFR